MKKITFLFLLLSIELIGQTHQKDILSFVDSSIGKKVGKGICYELVQKAFQQYNPSYDMGAIKRNIDRYGKKVKTPMPGDIIVEDGNGIYHVGVVYKVVDEDIYVAEQNTNESLQKSIVEVNKLDIEWMKNNSVDFYFYRPK